MKNTKENNILIAELEGKKIITANEFNKLGEQAYTGENKNVDWGIIEYLDYHKNWNSLMPVVEKIEHIDNSETGNEFQVVIYEEEISIMDKRQYPFLEIINIPCDGESKLTNTYKAVIEFIKWYNENK